jgi:hypothetical protein
MLTLPNELKTPSSKQGTKVRIPWKRGDTISDWDATCIWAIEHYGLPGFYKYYTHCTENYMDFYFYDEKDAIHFGLRWL